MLAVMKSPNGNILNKKGSSDINVSIQIKDKGAVA